MRIGFQNPQVAYGAMTIYDALGDHDAAVSAAADALVAAPGLASDPGWSASAAAEELFSAAFPVALERAEPAIGYRIAMEAGRADEASRIASSLPDGDQEVAEAAVGAWFGDAASFDELHKLATANPLHNTYVATCRRVGVHSQGPDWPYEWTGDCTGTGPFEYPAVRVGPPVEGRATLPGPDATWHFQYVYRRLVPNDEIVPSVPHLRSVTSGSQETPGVEAARPRL